jgi:hypothetical protein
MSASTIAAPPCNEMALVSTNFGTTLTDKMEMRTTTMISSTRVKPLESATIWKLFWANTLIPPTFVFSESRLNHKDYLLLTLTALNDRVSRNLPYFIWCKSYAKARSFALVVAIWLDLSPPLAGGDKGEGAILSNRNDYNFSPPPQSSPVEGGGSLGLLDRYYLFARAY